MQKPRDPNWGLHKGDSSRVLTPRSTEAPTRKAATPPHIMTGTFLSLGFTSLKTGNQVGLWVYKLMRQETKAH